MGWFDRLYVEAGDRNHALVPWADGVPNPHLTAWADRERLAGAGRTACVVGCGYGDDAVSLAARGFSVTAFDLSPRAIGECRRIRGATGVRWITADLFVPPVGWTRAFDFVFEAYTIQALPLDARKDAPRACAELVAPGGTLLVVCRGREESDPPGDLPWPLTKSECAKFIDAGLTEIRFEDYTDSESPPRRRFRIAYRRPG